MKLCDSMAIEARGLLVTGFVQGVGYRAWAQRTAQELGLGGWVRNLDDGRVEIHAEGDGARLAEFADLCERGPTYAAVEGVESTIARCEGIHEFTIVRTAAVPAAR